MLKNFFLVLCFVALVCFAGCSSKNDESAIAEKGPAGSSGSVEAEGVSAARIDQLQKKLQHAKGEDAGNPAWLTEVRGGGADVCLSASRWRAAKDVSEAITTKEVLPSYLNVSGEEVKTLYGELSIALARDYIWALKNPKKAPEKCTNDRTWKPQDTLTVAEELILLLKITGKSPAQMEISPEFIREQLVKGYKKELAIYIAELRRIMPEAGPAGSDLSGLIEYYIREAGEKYNISPAEIGVTEADRKKLNLG